MIGTIYTNNIVFGFLPQLNLSPKEREIMEYIICLNNITHVNVALTKDKRLISG